ncbi:hypothetical protein SLH46_04685 [Draconibacterium sp. IB214405]|uniref:hypothetical protein n=1 Tax=Draconibacterium sp. IB214405 TaxID=3097352 RepID=UPI002A1278C4|nr:hypothetical protein [Draconibacterium sp. IB214405]MDX8338465.1 hypothetical protein [Draconibacterium sp. IB214405]
MQKETILKTLLLFFILADLTFSFLQYYNSPLYGDTDSHILPDKNIQKVIDDPFGFKVISSGEKHANPNRYFVHYSYMKYFQETPLLLQKLTNPISSVYLSAALIKIIIQVLFIYLLASFISKQRSIFNLNFLIAAALTLPLFQVYGYWSRLGINDQSIAYTFFYALPLILLMVFFKPIFDNLHIGKKVKTHTFILLAPLLIILPLSGPLIPAVSGIIILLITLRVLIRLNTTKIPDIRNILKNFPNWFYILLVPMALVCLYSIFLNSYNSQDQGEVVTLSERYMLLPMGIWKHVFHSLGLPLLLALISLNIFLIKKTNSEEGNKLISTLKWIGIFSLIYILLLPMGGYRTYRPLIVRYDTIMPVTVALIYFFGASTFYLLETLTAKHKKRFGILIVVCLSLFTIVDAEGLDKNDCEKKAFQKMASSQEKIVRLPKDCYVMNWSNIYDYKKSERRAELIHYWKITPELKLFYNEE